MTRMTFVAAMKHYFGLKPEQTAAQFLQEIKALTPKDRTDFTIMLSGAGYDIEGAIQAAA